MQPRQIAAPHRLEGLLREGSRLVGVVVAELGVQPGSSLGEHRALGGQAVLGDHVLDQLVVVALEPDWVGFQERRDVVSGLEHVGVAQHQRPAVLGARHETDGGLEHVHARALRADQRQPYSATDIASYQSCYGTNTSLTNINVDGGPGSGVGSGEAALDIENLIGLAPQASILVYEGKNTGSGAYDTYRTVVSQNRAQVVSTSWGLCEPQEGSSAAGAENDLFIEAVTQGQTVFAASGDRGVQDCTGNHTSAPTVDDPASQPWVTGVGGTSLTSAGPPPTETAWNSSWNGGASSGAGGGGVRPSGARPPISRASPSPSHP